MEVLNGNDERQVQISEHVELGTAMGESSPRYFPAVVVFSCLAGAPDAEVHSRYFMNRSEKH